MENLDKIIESILFVAGEGVEIADIAEKLQVDLSEIENVVEKMKVDRVNSGIQLIQYKNKIQLCSNPELASFVEEVLNPIKEKQLTRAVLEVAAIIAYKQPITRLEIENVRGVNSDYAVNCLIDNNLIESVGRKDAIGKPLLYATTENFLKKFALESIAELPDYEDVLSRIAVIEQPKNNSLLNFEDYSEKDELLETKEEEVETIQKEIISESNDEVEFSQDYIKSLFKKDNKSSYDPDDAVDVLGKILGKVSDCDENEDVIS